MKQHRPQHMLTVVNATGASVISETLRYLLDTNTISALARQPRGAAARHVGQVGEHTICTSLVVASEIRCGLRRRGSKRLTERLEAVLALLKVLPLEAPVDLHYTEIRDDLEIAGTPIGPNDLLIAADARSLHLTVVTDNVAEFSRVPGLAVENWLDSRG